MGFYGNITNTSKTTFSFDLIYPSRSEMDSQADKDGVFLGRYVLVDYGEDPIKGYFNPKDSLFYHTPSFTTGTAFYGKEGTIYQDINNALSAGGFYRYDINQQIYVPMLSKTPYQERFQLDVKNYGRGYDSTAWVKRYDPAANNGSGGYKYVAIAELNAVVPTFHMVVSKPNASPVPPYFDRDTTNIDYYLHMQGDFSTRVKEAQDGIKSDETAIRTRHEWKVDESGYQYYNAITEEVPADIYFNNAGFDEKTRYYDSDKITYNLKDDKYQVIPGSPLKEIDYSKNTIGYDMGRSTRLYGDEADMGTYEFGTPEDDIYDWYVRLPGIGNAICKMWDKVYDDRGNESLRALNKALKREDTDDHLVTYNKSTVMGMLNTTQDLLGYYFIPIGTQNDIEGNEITSAQNITIELIPENGVAPYTATYPILSCLFYDKPEGNAPVKNYYHYKYDPTYTEIIPEDPNKDYYYKTNDGLFRRANISTYGATDANGNNLEYAKYYERHDRWILSSLEYEMEDSVYALIAAIHNLMGTNADDVRNIDTMKGAINIIKDIISSIDLSLSPGKLLHTNNQGVIETTDTYFPAADWNKDKILDGNGDWVSRFASVKVLNNSNNANQNAPKVNIITNGAEQNVSKTIVSDNDKTNYGTSLVNNKKHTTNNLTLGTRNKWIELYGDEVDDSVEFKHSTSPVISRLRSEQATGTEYLDMYTTTDENGNVVLQDSTGYHNFSINDTSTEIKIEPTTDTLDYVSGINDQDDNRLTIPYLTVDNAGHVVELGTKNFNIPHTYKHITLTEQSNSEDFIIPTHGDQEADFLTDRLTFSTGNKWIEARIDEDKITHSHKLVPNNTLSNSVSLNGDRRTNTADIETVYRYGLPNDKTIAILDEINGNEAANTFNIPYIEVDKAGHVVAAETHTVELPDNYTTIIVGEENTSIGSGTNTGTEGETSDNFAGAATLKAESLTESITFNPSNKWIRLKGENTKGLDTITIGHEIHNIIATTSNEDLDLVTNTTNDSRTQKATFDTQTVRWDNAGHITGYDTKTWTLPDSFHNIVVGGESAEVKNGTSGSGTLIADTTFDSFSIVPSNKWIRLYGNPVNDSIVVGHLVQDISTTTPTTDLNTSGTFNTEEYTYDEAGHIRSKAVRTLTLPYNYKTFIVSQSTNETAITANTSSIIAQNQVDTMKFAAGNKWIQLAASDANTSGNDTITIAHSLQGIAGSYTGTDLAFTEFGGEVTIYGYETDNAGHIISNPTYTLTLPKGSYSNSASNKLANVITGMEFNEKTGAITTTSENVGTLVLTGYTKLDTTAIASITATNTINEAFARLDNRIETEEEARDSAITNLRMFKTISVGGTALEADSNADTLSITAGNNGIVLTPTASNDSFTISHKTGHEVANGFYKFSTDAYGHIFVTEAVTLSDLTNLGAATAENLTTHVTTVTGNPHGVTAEDVGLKNVTNESKTTMFTSPTFTGTPKAPTATEGTNTQQIATTAFVTTAVKNASDKVAWASNYIDFDAVYAAVKQKLEEEYTLIPKEKEEEENPIV